MPPPGDLIPRQVKAEDHSSFYVGGGFGRVDVLLLLVLPDGPRSEGQHLAAFVADRDHEPLGEEVRPVAAHQAGLLGVEERAFLRAQVFGEAAACRRVAELKPPGRLFVDPARFEEAAPRLARRAFPQDVLVVLGRELEQGEHPLAHVGAVFLLRAQLLELDARPLGEEEQGAALVGLLDQLDEGEDVAFALASEAVPGLALRVDVEAGAVLLVEWTQPPVVLVALREADMLLDDLDQVDLGLDLREGVIGRQGGHAHYSASAWTATPPHSWGGGAAGAGDGAAPLA